MKFELPESNAPHKRIFTADVGSLDPLLVLLYYHLHVV